MKKITTLALAFALCLGLAAQALAHTPICSCYDDGGTIVCEGGFSDGSSAAGVKISVMDGSGATVTSGKMDENSEFSFTKPSGDYTVLFDAGKGHTIEIPGSEIME